MMNLKQIRLQRGLRMAVLSLRDGAHLMRRSGIICGEGRR